MRLFVGFDQREAVAYHVFCQSVIDTASMPVEFHPVAAGMTHFDGQRDGTNAFIFSRYLVPLMCGFQGWAIFADGDMICKRDIAELWEYRNNLTDKAVGVVKHDYRTKHSRKYVGSSIENANRDYPRKNWSSVILWNCSHFGNRCLEADYVAKTEGKDLHRFAWLKDDAIGDLPHDWNVLVGEDPPGPAAIHHFTLGVPGLKHYADDHASWNWHMSFLRALECAGEEASKMTARAEGRIGAL